jgi:metacaspase-1
VGRATHGVRVRRKRHASVGESPGVHQDNEAPNEKGDTQPVVADIKTATAKLKPNDIFFLSYSGHGGQVPNTGNDFEPDGFDETWCLYDGELIDDELYTALKQFVKGVRTPDYKPG